MPRVWDILFAISIRVSVIENGRRLFTRSVVQLWICKIWNAVYDVTRTSKLCSIYVDVYTCRREKILEGSWAFVLAKHRPWPNGFHVNCDRLALTSSLEIARPNGTIGNK